jgi:PAS domain S-box-containing protein
MTSQQNLIKKEERNLILQHYRYFMERVKQRELQSLSIASSIAEIPNVARLLARRDRSALHDLLIAPYKALQKNNDISQFHFHIPPGISFLRLHKPEHYGDKLESYRKSVSQALAGSKPSACLERGATGLGIRGVVPIYYEGNIVGSIEIGFSFGKTFVESFHRSWKINTTLYEVESKGKYRLLASSGDFSLPDITDLYKHNENSKNPVVLIAPEKHPDQSIIIAPVVNCSGKTVALIVFNKDRTEIIKRLAGTQNLMISMGFAVIIISFLFIYLVIDLFIKPIKEIVDEAQDIALGKRESRLEEKPADEIGSLTNTLNTMLDALKNRRIQIEDYAKTLEKRVDERTTELLASEEKYRAVVENVPVVVFRILKDGTTEFVNSYLTENIGYSVEEAVGDKRFWRDKIASEDPEAFYTIRETCFTKGEDCRLDHKVRAKDGRLLYFITHSIPGKDKDGAVQWVDGFMLDITELKRLQERAIQTEEIRTLGEISARMAHEIRNPLSIAGGFARRLRDALDIEDPNKKLALIIVEEVAKLEIFVTGLLSTITPFELSLTAVNLNEIIEESVSELEQLCNSRKIKIAAELKTDIPDIQADNKLLCQAIINILKHSVVSTPPGKSISISTVIADEEIIFEITHIVEHMSSADIEQFFFPHIEPNLEESVLDLPLSKIIIHRHGGKIDLIKGENNLFKIIISFPTAQD